MYKNHFINIQFVEKSLLQSFSTNIINKMPENVTKQKLSEIFKEEIELFSNSMSSMNNIENLDNNIKLNKTEEPSIVDINPVTRVNLTQMPLCLSNPLKTKKDLEVTKIPSSVFGNKNVDNLFIAENKDFLINTNESSILTLNKKDFSHKLFFDNFSNKFSEKVIIFYNDESKEMKESCNNIKYEKNFMKLLIITHSKYLISNVLNNSNHVKLLDTDDLEGSGVWSISLSDSSVVDQFIQILEKNKYEYNFFDIEYFSIIKKMIKNYKEDDSYYFCFSYFEYERKVYFIGETYVYSRLNLEKLLPKYFIVCEGNKNLFYFDKSSKDLIIDQIKKNYLSYQNFSSDTEFNFFIYQNSLSKFYVNYCINKEFFYKSGNEIYVDEESLVGF